MRLICLTSDGLLSGRNQIFGEKKIKEETLFSLRAGNFDFTQKLFCLWEIFEKMVAL